VLSSLPPVAAEEGEAAANYVVSHDHDTLAAASPVQKDHDPTQA